MSLGAQTPVSLDYFLKPGFIYLPEKPTAISTVLGSSVAVTLYDKTLKMGGMNHFLYPCTENRETATARYGNIAILTLLKMMTANGARPSRIQAQVFGGAHNRKYATKNMGRDNLAAARQILKQKKIRIVSEDTGGELGRKVVFNTASCEIVTLKVDRLRQSDWYPYPEER